MKNDLRHRIYNFTKGRVAEVLGVTDEDKQFKFNAENADAELYEFWYTKYQSSDSSLFYSRPDYLYSAILSWSNWTWGSVNNTILFLKTVGYSPKKIFNFGGGLGGETVQFALAFPEATVFYNNIPCVQSDIARQVFEHFNLTNVIISENLMSADVVTAYEVFEHIKSPMVPLNGLLDNDETRVYVDCSTFSKDAPGHYDYYMLDNKLIKNTQFRRIFNRRLKDLGFVQAYENMGDRWTKKFWNNRPAIYIRKLNKVLI